MTEDGDTTGDGTMTGDGDMTGDDGMVGDGDIIVELKGATDPETGTVVDKGELLHIKNFYYNVGDCVKVLGPKACLGFEEGGTLVEIKGVTNISTGEFVNHHYLVHISTLYSTMEQCRTVLGDACDKIDIRNEENGGCTAESETEDNGHDYVK